MSATAVTLLLIPLWPGSLALATFVFRRRHPGGFLSLLAPLPALFAGLDPPVSAEASYSWLLLGTRFGLDEKDAVFLLFTAIVWLLASSFAFEWMHRGRGRERFFAFFLLTMSGNLGALVAQDMPSFYAFFALMSFAAYGLIAHERTREARHSANVYIALVVVGEAALAAALIIAAGSIGATDFLSVRSGLEAAPLGQLIIGLAFLGFGIKAGALILHVWLPLAHPVAPTPASAVLSGAIIVAGLVGWLRLLPIGEWALPGWGGMFVALGLAAAVYGAFVGMDQRRPKVVLAYSSISQMGIMTAGVGMILLEPSMSEMLSIAIALFALHHGLAKCSLFLGAGLAKTRMNSGRRRRLVLGLAVPAFALAGAPLTSGMIAKSAIVAGESFLPQPWAGLAEPIFLLTSVVTALLMARFLVLIARSPADAKASAARKPWQTWWASVLLVFLLPLWLGPAAGFSWSTPTLINSLWPLGVALLVAIIATGIWRQAGRPSVPEIPAGDVLLPLEWLTLRARDGASSLARDLRARREWLARTSAAGRGRAWALIQSAGQVETLLNRWAVAVTLALLLGAAVAWLAA